MRNRELVKRENNQENKEIGKVKKDYFKSLAKYFSHIVFPTCITKSLLFAKQIPSHTVL